METHELDRLFQRTVMQLFTQKGAGFLMTIFSHLRFEWSDRIPTACVTYDKMMWNPDFYQKLSESDRVFVLAHELDHVAYDHLGRLKDRDMQLFNMAADHAINLHLFACGYTFTNQEYKPLADSRFKDMITEEIYDILKEENPPIDLPFGSDFAPGDGMGGPPTEDQQNNIREILVKAATIAKMTDSWGDVPGEIKDHLETLLRPTISWEVQLRKYMVKLVNGSYGYHRPNRRSRTLILPSKKKRQEGLEHITWAFDTSGSMRDEDIERCLAEVKHVHNSMKPDLTEIIEFDCSLQKVMRFTKAEEIKSIPVHGRGGTDFDCVFNEINSRRQADKPKLLIIMSDMDCSITSADLNPGMPVIWLTYGKKKATVNFGHTISFHA